ncbi:MAG TPA: hypothetical protein VLC93_08235, partial [Myxococcota bacterium]|nr:hypothetical protein [Myxococcota bacterium]
RATAIAVMKTKVQGKSKTTSFVSQLSVADLEAVKANIAAGKGYDGIPELTGPDAVHRVAALDAYLGAPKVGPKGEGTIPDFLIDALWSEPHKEAAKLIAGKFGRIPAKETILDNGALKQAVALLDKPDELARAFQDGGKKLYAGNITDFMDKIRDLREFMASGTNGLANHGPVYINGEAFYCVVPLPEVRGIPRPSPNRPEDERAQQFQDMFNKMIAHYDPGFNESGYDRVYIQSDGETPEKSKLYVAVRDKGEIKNITYNDRVSFSAKSTSSPTVAAFSAAGDKSLTGEVGEIRLTGRVLWKADVPNTRRESATTFVKNLFRSSIRRHREKYNPNPTLPGLAPTGGPGFAGPGGPAPFVGGSGARGLAPSYYPGGVLGAGTTALGLSAFTGAMAATAYFSVQQMLSGALVTGAVSLAALIGTVLAFEYERATTPKSINPILNAAGLSVQGKRLLAEEF